MLVRDMCCNPTITIGSPYMKAGGNFIDNETVTGSSSGITALVKTWNAVSGGVSNF